MKLVNYLFANKLSIRGWMWRCSLIIFGLSVVGLIAGSFFVNQWLTTDRIRSLLNAPEVITEIDKISNFLSGDQYIQISEASGFITNKTGVRIQSSNSIVEVDLDASCEDWFTTTSKKGALLTNRSICIRDTSKQQILKRSEIMSGITTTTGVQNTKINDLITHYPSLSQMISGDTVIITTDVLQQIETDINTLAEDPQIMDTVVGGIGIIAIMMLIPLGLMIIFFVIVMTIILFIGLAIYSLITRAIAGIMSYEISFKQAFSLSRLPWIIVKVGGSLVGLDWVSRVIVWIIIITLIIYYHKQHKHEAKSE